MGGNRRGSICDQGRVLCVLLRGASGPVSSDSRWRSTVHKKYQKGLQGGEAFFSPSHRVVRFFFTLPDTLRVQYIATASERAGKKKQAACRRATSVISKLDHLGTRAIVERSRLCQVQGRLQGTVDKKNAGGTARATLRTTLCKARLGPIWFVRGGCKPRYTPKTAIYLLAPLTPVSFMVSRAR